MLRVKIVKLGYKLIIVKLIGGLGNQMFQYALGRHLAIINNCSLKLDIRGFKDYKLRNYDLNCFNIQQNIATSEDLSGTILPSDRFTRKIRKRLEFMVTDFQQMKYIKESDGDFQPEILGIRDSVYLDGYWQSEKYFSDIKDVIKKEFTVKNRPDTINKSFLEDIAECESVSVHVRRGDYISNLKTNKVHGFLGPEYYQRAINIMLEKIDNPHFVVFSDDHDWAERNIKTDAPITYIKHNGAKNYEDMRLMRTCKHHIIANSSFSWWGAWLASNEGKIVIGPSKWFQEKDYNDLDRMPENWLRV